MTSWAFFRGVTARQPPVPEHQWEPVWSKGFEVIRCLVEAIDIGQQSDEHGAPGEKATGDGILARASFRASAVHPHRLRDRLTYAARISSA